MRDIATWFQTENLLDSVDFINVNIDVINSKTNKQLSMCLKIMNKNLWLFQPKSMFFLKLTFYFSAVFEFILYFSVYIELIHAHAHLQACFLCKTCRNRFHWVKAMLFFLTVLYELAARSQWFSTKEKKLWK